MDPLLSPASLALVTTALLLLSWLLLRRRRAGRREASREALDTLAAWPPEAARVLSMPERQAQELLRRAVPNHLVLAQVPLSRFIRVPARHSYNEWLQRVGSLSADLLVCDAGSRVLAVVDIRQPEESSRSRRRHERMARVLRKAGVHVLTWQAGALPPASEVRSQIAAVLSASAARAGTPSQPMPLIPVPDIAEVLAEGDRAAAAGAFDPALEPVPSSFHDDTELQLEPADARR